MKRLIIFLIRKRLGLKQYEEFQFSNQKSNAVYWFADTCVRKMDKAGIQESSVSLNWLLNDDCEVMKRGDERWRN